MTRDFAGVFCAAAAISFVVSFMRCATTHAIDSDTATCPISDDAPGPPAPEVSLAQLDAARGRYTVSVERKGATPRVATRRADTRAPQKYLAGVPVYNYHIVEQKASVLSALREGPWLPPASSAPSQPLSAAPVSEQAPAGAVQNDDLLAPQTVKEPAPTAGAELPPASSAPSQPPSAAPVSEQAPTGAVQNDDLLAPPSAPVVCEDTFTILTFEGVTHRDCPSLISATNRNGVNWWCNTQENNLKSCQLTCGKCALQAGGETRSAGLPEAQPSTTPDTTSAKAPSNNAKAGDCSEGHVWCEPLHQCISERQLCVKEESAWRAEQRDWFVGVPAQFTDAQVAEFCIDLPGNAYCAYLGHPEEHGVPFLEVHATELELEEILKLHPGADFVEPDAPVFGTFDFHMDEVVDGSQVPWGLDRIDDQDGLDGSYDVPVDGGRDVNVYIADTGVRTTHQSFQGRAVPTLEIVGQGVKECDDPNTECAFDRNGHGTHCAGTVGATSYGVAQGTKLYSMKVLNDEGAGHLSWLVEMFDWIAVKGQRPAVVSVSIATPGIWRAVQVAINTVVAEGVTVVAAAGNAKEDACAWSPAYLDTAITVGATHNGEDRMASYSNWGTCIDILAPGSDILSAHSVSDTAQSLMSGTSMACPHVAGAAALLLSREPSLSPAEVKARLASHATRANIQGLPQGTTNLLLYAGGLGGSALIDKSDSVGGGGAFSFRLRGRTPNTSNVDEKSTEPLVAWRPLKHVG